MSEPIHIEEIAHKAALELAHRCGVAEADIDMAEVIIRQALRDVLEAIDITE